MDFLTNKYKLKSDLCTFCTLYGISKKLNLNLKINNFSITFSGKNKIQIKRQKQSTMFSFEH